MVGDINVWCDQMYTTVSSHFRWDESRTTLLNVMATKGLVDVWRERNPGKREYSRRQVVMGKMRQSRIDLCHATRETTRYLKKCWHEHCIMVGNFNVWCDRLYAMANIRFRWDESRTTLLNVMATKGLVDVWRERNPAKREYSRRQVDTGKMRKSRIDLCLATRERTR
ncbi:unnamed protein product [Coregonus sp. 'balchen']|nr:unnamed protein product [Coregonus sp. 'balchen']